MTTRRDFLRSAAAATAAGLVLPRVGGGAILVPSRIGVAEPDIKALLADALQAARDAGASYADARVGHYRRQSVNTRDRQVTGVSDAESLGLGVRALVSGSWGFAATSDLSRDGARLAAREAARIARAARPMQKRPVELAPATPVTGTWRTPVRTDPLEVAIEDKVALLLAANETALKVKGINFVSSGMALLREEKHLATTDGTATTQTFVRVGPQFTATAVGTGDFQSYNH